MAGQQQRQLFGPERETTDFSGRRQHEISVQGSPRDSFPDWVRGSSDAEVVSFFRRVTTELEQERRLEDYHLKIQNGWDPHLRRAEPGWKVVVFYRAAGESAGGEEDEEDGPLNVDRCMSCDMDCPLRLGVTGSLEPQGAGAGKAGAAPAAGAAGTGAAAGAGGTGTGVAGAGAPPGGEGTSAGEAAAGAEGTGAAEGQVPGQGGSSDKHTQPDVGPVSRDSLVEEREHVRIWLDAKARPMLVVTPLPHKERLSELSDEELVQLWRAGVETMQVLGIRRLLSGILNHGNQRNHAHLHLKLRFDNREWRGAMAGADPDLQAKLSRLEAFAAGLPLTGKFARYQQARDQQRAHQYGGGGGGWRGQGRGQVQHWRGGDGRGWQGQGQGHGQWGGGWQGDKGQQPWQHGGKGSQQQQGSGDRRGWGQGQGEREEHGPSPEKQQRIR